MIEEDIYQRLKDYIESECSLKECSKDDRNTQHVAYLTELEHTCINFDDVMKKYCKLEKLSGSLCSADSIFFKNQTLYIVEFKNQKSQDIKWNDISLKMHESIFLLKELLPIEDCDLKGLEMIVVYKNNPTHQRKIDALRKNMSTRISNPDKIDRLNIFENKYEVITKKLSEKDFRDKIVCV
ncbi:hypothetical protein [Lactococcus lactis]|uniref:hypothetical protein n=1 Tax=Lactococcus lactis TaxID=1358 RepID=UPI00315D07D5